MKYAITIFVIISFYIFVSNVSSAYNLIPEDAIRIRVIANSNSEYDQKIKEDVSYLIKNDMYQVLKDIKGVNSAKKEIKENINSLTNEIDKFLNKKKYNLGFKVNYGQNYFPKKEYKGITYKEGYYESLVVTLGEGKGENWWCVMFPPLCLIEAKDSTDIEYTTITKELMDKYL